NCASALDFHDPAFAIETLKTLQGSPNIRAAAAYDLAGNLFATYSKHDQYTNLIARTPEGAGTEFLSSELRVTEKIQRGGRHLGTLVVHRGLNDFYERLLQNALTAAGIL